MSVVSAAGVAQGGLLGRDGEREQIDRLLDETRAGASNTLVLRGEAGIGKTALLEYAISQAGGARVLRCRGVEWESELPFSGLVELLRPLVDSIPGLPETQRAALGGVLALAPPVAVDRFAAYVATLSLLAQASRTGPLVVMIDDAHWLDGSSTEALAFVAKRLRAEGILLLVALRDEGRSPFVELGFRQLVVTGLESGAAEELLLRHHPGLEQPVVRAVLDATGGNPLALRELPAFFDLAGMPSEVEPLQTGPVIEDAFLRRVRGLPDETQRALVVASASGLVGRHTILTAVESLGLPREALDPAEEAGLIAGGTDRLVFRHPLVRSAVYSGASPKERRAVHLALAEASDPDALDQRAWHRAAGTESADESVAAGLEEAGRRARPERSRSVSAGLRAGSSSHAGG